MKSNEAVHNKTVQCPSHVFMCIYSFEGFGFQIWTDQYFNINTVRKYTLIVEDLI